jgi:hypothetical protein
MEVGHESVAESFEPDQHIVGGGHVGYDAHGRAPLMGELGALIEHGDTLDFRARDKEELFARIRREFLEAVVKEQRAHRIPPGSVRCRSILRLDSFESLEKFVRLPDVRAYPARILADARGVRKPRKQFLAALNQIPPLLFKVCFLHDW